MEALSGSASLDDFVTKIEAADWAGCDARAFARAAAEKLVTPSKAEKQYRNDTAGEKARVAGIYDLAKRASSRAAARAEWMRIYKGGSTAATVNSGFYYCSFCYGA